MVGLSGDVGPETTTQVVHYLSEVDALLRDEKVFGDDGAALMTYLKSSEDISSVLHRNDLELHELCELFIETQINQADKICSVYDDFSKCEEQLVDFETAIVSFQQKLGKASDDIALMHQQTDRLARSVRHCRSVSGKINEICSALQDCDSFCEEIVSRDVDQGYLTNLRELENSLVFLSRKELRASAVDNEIRPKLTGVALKAGNKLQRFLTKQIMALGSNLDNLESNQQILEQNGHFAYSFLRSYNAPVSEEIEKLYVSNMSGVYRKKLETLLRSFVEASELRAQPLDPIILSKEVTAILSNHDTGSPAGNQVEAPSWNGFPARTLTPRERSVSRHILSLTNIFTKSDSSHVLREATFNDTVAVVRSLEVRHGRLQSCPESAAHLDQCDCWVWQLIKCLQTLVNICMMECRFIGSFFSFASESGEYESTHETERLSHAVLDPTIRAVESAIKEFAPSVLDRTDVLAALRCIDIVKQYLCTMQDPIPLLLLSGMLETSKSIFKTNLRITLHNDRVALGYLSSMKLRAFHRAPALNAKNLTKLLYEQDYAATLGPQTTLLRIGELLGQLELLNTAPFFCFCLAKGDAIGRTYDTHASAFIATALGNLLDFIEQLAKRHPSVLSRCFFTCVNVFCVHDAWRTLGLQFAQKGLMDSHLNAITPSWKSSDAAHSASTGNSVDPLVSSDDSSSYFYDLKHTKLLESRLEKALEMLVAAYVENQSSFDYFFRFERDAEAELGEDFFSSITDEEGGALDEPQVRSASLTLSAAKTLEVVTTFHDQWHDQFREVVADITQAAQAIFEGVPSITHSRSTLKHLCSEFMQSILFTYCCGVVRVNDRVSILASKVYATNSEIQSKLISSSVLTSEMHRTIRHDIQ